jgi:hypothetical protein
MSPKTDNQDEAVPLPGDPPAHPTDLSGYRIIKPSLFEHRSVRLASTLVLFITLAALACQIKWTPAHRADIPETSAFQAVKITPPQVVPPPPAPENTGLSTPPAPESAPAPPKVITAGPNFQPTFEMPQVEIPQMAIPSPTARIDNNAGNSTDPSNGSNGNGPANSSNQDGTNGQATAGAGYAVTDPFAYLIASLGNTLDADTRSGEAIGAFRPSEETWPFAQEIDALRHSPKLKATWLLAKNDPGIVLAPDGIPILTQEHDEFTKYPSGSGTRIAIQLLLDAVKNRSGIKTVVLIADFAQNADQQKINDLVDALRKNNIRLLIIVLEAEPYPKLHDYANESKGVTIYAHQITAQEMFQKQTDGN